MGAQIFFVSPQIANPQISEVYVQVRKSQNLCIYRKFGWCPSPRIANPQIFMDKSSVSDPDPQKLTGRSKTLTAATSLSNLFLNFSDELNFLKEDAEIDQMTRMLPDFWANCLFLNVLDKFNFLDSEIDRDELEHCQLLPACEIYF
jgi:hypothetical protein